MKEVGNVKAVVGESAKFPETVKLELGKAVVMIWNGDRREHNGQAILDVLLVEDRATTRSVFWPVKLPLPPVATPFKIVKVKDGVKGQARAQYSLLMPTTDAERLELWPNV